MYEPWPLLFEESLPPASPSGVSSANPETKATPQLIVKLEFKPESPNSFTFERTCEYQQHKPMFRSIARPDTNQPTQTANTTNQTTNFEPAPLLKPKAIRRKVVVERVTRSLRRYLSSNPTWSLHKR
jgi:hypothetical protein